MRYISIAEENSVVIKEMPIPKPGPGEALLELLYGGICGSDLATYRGGFLYSSYPRIPGHEFSARILEIEENEYGLEKGMLVTANPYFNCGRCYSCRRGHVNCCQSNETMGVQRDGAFCQFITMPVSRLYDGQGLDPLKLSLVEPFCISYHGVKRLSVKPGDRVLVVGAGTIGYFAAVAARLFGGDVTCCDISAGKLENPKKLGMQTILNSGKEDFHAQVESITAGHGFDVCIEAAGQAQTFLDCIDAAAYRGRVGVIGVSKRNADFLCSLIQKKELDIFGSRNATRADFEEVITLFRSGTLDPTAAVSAIYPFEKADRAFSETVAAGDRIKVMLQFKEA